MWNFESLGMTHRALLPFVIAVTTSIACGSTSTSTNVGPTPVRCAVAATPNPSTFPAAGGNGNLVVSAARECSWSASSQAAWISLVPPTEGQGDGSIRYNVAANPTAIARRGTLVLGPVSADVTQQPAACRSELDRRSFEFAASEQTADVKVEAPSGCAWSAKASVSWITVVEGATGNGTGRVRFRASSNSGIATRSGSLEVAGQRVDVRQLGTPCDYSIGPKSESFLARGGSGRIDVQTRAVCQWSAATTDSWIVITSPVEASGNGRVEYEVQPNSATTPRIGNITVAGQTFTVTQDEATSILGRARNIEGSCPNKRFTVSGQSVRTTRSTDYEDGNCGDIRTFVTVRVTGIVGSDNVLTASEVEF
jgi:hypothetical protein